jgi:hypothetical protein
MKTTIFKSIRSAVRRLLPVGLLALTAAFTACSDDDNGSSAQMTISKIYLEDVNAPDSVYDREVTFARLGQLIRIEGAGFTGLKKILINGYDTYFNNALLTDNNVWVTLNANTPVDKADESVRNTITLVKDNGTFTYPFTVRAASPSVTSVDNTLPQPGETVTVYGANLQETAKVTLPGGIEVTSGIVNDPEGKWYSFVMPSGVTAAGSITSEGANGTAKTPAYFNNNNCFVINFDGKGEQGSWSATYSADDLVDDPLNSGRGKVCQLLPQSLLDAGGLMAGSNAKGFWTAGNGNANDDWNRMTAFIPGTTPVDSVALQFDVYVPEDWYGTGQLEITLQNNLANYGYGSAGTKYSSSYYNQAYAWVPWLNRTTGAATPYNTGGKWKTVTLPLSYFGNYTDASTAWTFQRVIDDRNAGSYRNFGFLFVNPDLTFDDTHVYPARDFAQKIYVDNFRIVPCTAITVSDY